jgi:peptide/nickel transport system substrate-binding protein
VKRSFCALAALAFLFSTLLANSAYGHGLGQDQSLPITVGGKQLAVEGIMRPAVVPFTMSDRPFLLIRLFDQNSNVTVSGIDYRIAVALQNDTLLDQRFKSADGVFLANLLPDKNITGWQITGHESAGPQDPIDVNQHDPVEIRSEILATGGLYRIIVVVEKDSPGIAAPNDLRFDLFISVTHALHFTAETDEGQADIVVKTYYDDVTDFGYQNGTIEFEMPFDWDPAYLALVPVLHMELQFPKSIEALKTNSYRGSLNGIELPAESIQIDDYTSEENRIVHFVVSNTRLLRLADSVEEGSDVALFTLRPAEKPKFPLDFLSAPTEKYLFQMSWGPEVIETGTPTTFVMNLQNPLTGDLARHSSFDPVFTQGGNEIHRKHMTSELGTFSYQYTFSQQGSVTLSAVNINGEGEGAKIELFVLQGSNSPPPPIDQPSGCLIATAAFGSELAPQVQYLRNFREQHILSTASGSAFISAFNAIYYSFSPQVADYEREQPWLQNMVKAGLYPLFGMLVASERAHSAIGGEAGAIVAGSIASSMIGSVYLLPAGISVGNKVRVTLLLAIVGVAASFLMATLALAPSLLPFSTSAFVLALAGSSAILAAKAVIAIKRRIWLGHN